MQNSVGNTMLGIAAAAAVGTAVYMMSSSGRSHSNMRKVKRSAEKTVRAMGNIVDGISEIVR
jgi:hypothetical protein